MHEIDALREVINGVFVLMQNERWLCNA